MPMINLSSIERVLEYAADVCFIESFKSNPPSISIVEEYQSQGLSRDIEVIIKDIILINKKNKAAIKSYNKKVMLVSDAFISEMIATYSPSLIQTSAYFILIMYNSRMQATNQQLHQIWLQCMQMNQCTPQAAIAFVSQVKSTINTPLTPSGQTLLMLAASVSSVNLVKAILSCRPNVKIRDSVGRSPLHYAAAVGCIEIFELLIKSGCDPVEETIGGETSLSKACLFAQGNIIEWYLNNCQKAFEVSDKLGKKPLQLLRNSGEQLYHEVKEVYEDLNRQMKDQY